MSKKSQQTNSHSVTSHPAPSLTQQQFELYRFRAEENERNFLSLRTVEWQIPFQIYAACGAIAAGFYSLKDYKGFGLNIHQTATVALLLLLVVFCIAVFWQTQILRRLHFNRAIQQEYIKLLHAKVAPDITVPSRVFVPKNHGWWAFLPMQIINFLVFGSVAAFIVNATPCVICLAP
jgi:hypothetical protein